MNGTTCHTTGRTADLDLMAHNVDLDDRPAENAKHHDVG